MSGRSSGNSERRTFRIGRSPGQTLASGPVVNFQIVQQASEGLLPADQGTCDAKHIRANSYASRLLPKGCGKAHEQFVGRERRSVTGKQHATCGVRV